MIPGVRPERVIIVNSPVYECPRCRLQFIGEGQGDELRRWVNLALSGKYQTLVRDAPFAPTVQEFVANPDAKELEVQLSRATLEVAHLCSFGYAQEKKRAVVDELIDGHDPECPKCGFPKSRPPTNRGGTSI